MSKKISSTSKSRSNTDKNKKTSIVKPPTVISSDARVRKKPKYKSFKLHKRVKHPSGPLPSWWVLTKKALKLMKVNRKNIFYFFLLYGFLTIVFVRGFSSPVNVDEIRDSFADITNTESSALATNFTVFSLMLQSTTSAAGDVGGLYQIFFLVVSVLALIWLFRQQQAGNKVSLKMAFYRGMYPLIPFILLLFIVALQTIPASVGNFLFRTVIDNGIAINALEQIIWFLLFILLVLLSGYLITTSAIALFVVTLPEMTPLKAQKKAKQLVMFRRFSILRKILALVIFVILLYVALVFPILFVSSVVAQIVYFLLTVIIVPFATAYLFVLYRELL